MNNSDSEKIKKIIEDRQHAHKFYSKNSKVYNAFIEMEKKTYADGELERNIRS